MVNLHSHYQRVNIHKACWVNSKRASPALTQLSFLRFSRDPVVRERCQLTVIPRETKRADNHKRGEKTVTKFIHCATTIKSLKNEEMSRNAHTTPALYLLLSACRRSSGLRVQISICTKRLKAPDFPD